MRVALEQLDTRGATLELPKARDGVGQVVTLRSAQKLRGVLEHDSDVLTLTGVVAEEIVIQAMGMMFGNVRLSEAELDAKAVRAELSKPEGHTLLDLEAGSIQAGGSAVDKGDLHIDGQVSLEQMRLSLRDGVGQLEFGMIEVKGFTLRDGPVSVVADSVIARNFRIGWGGGLTISAESLDASGFKLSAKGIDLQADGVAALGVAWLGGRAKVGSVSLARAKLVAELSHSSGAKRKEEGSGKAKLSDFIGSGRADGYLRILDALFGHVDVDVRVDLSVPVIGSRSAVHEMRIPIEKGSVDYRKLESNLATLEDSLLDFAVRDGALGLELGIPLLPTRGRGKQLVVWDLSDRDLALAERNRVRLAVLPKARVVADSSSSQKKEPKDEEKDKPAIGLRHVGLSNIDVHLGLAQEVKESDAVLSRLSLDGLDLHGNVHHDPEGPPEQGELTGGLSGLEAQLSHLPIGEDDLSVHKLQVERLSDVHVAFLGSQPTRLNADISSLSLIDGVFVQHVRAA